MVEFRLLGRVEVRVNGRVVPVSGLKPRQMLAALLLSPNTLVPVARLIDALWAHDPPRSARENLRTYATLLRRTFVAPGCDMSPSASLEDDGAGRGVTLTASRDGYLLAVAPECLDHAAFAALIEAARGELAGGRLELAAANLTAALASWRGRAGEGLPREGWLGSALHALDEQRLIAAEERADLWLELGRHAELVAELLRLLAEEPLRERLWRQLMVAQYRSGVAGEAIATYARARRVLADELGVDPGAELRDLHRAILRRDAGLVAAPRPWPGDAPARPSPAGVRRAGVPRPRQLPPATATFVGRTRSLAAVAEALAGAGDRPVVMSLAGGPGIGASAIALQAAHAAQPDFPDGQIYVDMRRRGQPRDDAGLLAVVHSLLRGWGCGVAHDVPLWEAASLLRSTMAGQRVLVVIDNAILADQVEPLLPTNRGSAALVTSPRGLGLEAVTHHLAVGPLGTATALTLLGRLAGPSRVEAEPVAAAALVRLCRHRPVLVRAVGAFLAEHPRVTVGLLWDRLRREPDTLFELRCGDLCVRDTYRTAREEMSIVDSRGAAEAPGVRILAGREPVRPARGGPSGRVVRRIARRPHYADLTLSGLTLDDLGLDDLGQKHVS